MHKRPLEHVCHSLLELEDGLGLFERQIDGVYYWEWVRLYVFNELVARLGLFAIPAFHKRKSLAACWRGLSKAIAGFLFHNPLVSDRKELFCFGHPGRVLHEDGRRWDVYLDPHLEHCDSYYYVARENAGYSTATLKSCGVKYFEPLALLAFLGRRFTRFHFPDRERRLLGEVEARLQARHGVNLDIAPILATILQTRRCLRWAYRQILERVRPRLAFFVSLNYPERAAVEVCKEMRIPTVEMQHGLIGPLDLSYVYPPGANVRLFTDHLFVFGDYWRQCQDFPIAASNIQTVGFPYLEKQQQIFEREAKEDVILFLSQPTIGASLSRFAVALASLPGLGHRVVYRLHPLETDWKRRYPWLLGSAVHVERANEASLYSRLARARLQVGVYSAALLEGMMFGLPTYLVDLPGVEFLDKLEALGLARRVTRPEEIDPHATPPVRVDRDSLFARNGIERFQQAMARLLAGQAGAAAQAA